MDKISEYKKWLNFAENDYEAVLLLSNNYKPLLEIVCFHCQQCAEKYLKSYIIKKEGEIKKTHNLEELCKSCTIYDQDFIQIKDACIDLTDYAVETRYPYSFEIDEIDMKKAISDMKFIKDFVLSKI